MAVVVTNLLVIVAVLILLLIMILIPNVVSDLRELSDTNDGQKWSKG